MGKAAFLYPGQASQYVGMGADLHEHYQTAREIYAQAEEILGFSLTEVCFDGPEEKLKQTATTQPAIFVHSVIVTELLVARGVSPKMAAGHSLGEYSALVAAGAIGFTDALALVKKRGQLMQEAGEICPGTMAAIIGLDADALAAICENASSEGIVQPANYNSPGQIVISGSIAGVHKAIELAQQEGAKRAIELVVSGAFHSPLMDHAKEELGVALESAEIRDANLPVYANVSAGPVLRAEDIKKLLFEQLSKPVLWESSVRAMIADGADMFYEVGPGKVLAGLQKRIDRSAPIATVGTAEELELL